MFPKFKIYRAYLFGYKFMLWRDNHPMPLTFRHDRIWWGDLNLVWEKV